MGRSSLAWHESIRWPPSTCSPPKNRTDDEDHREWSSSSIIRVGGPKRNCKSGRALKRRRSGFAGLRPIAAALTHARTCIPSPAPPRTEIRLCGPPSGPPSIKLVPPLANKHDNSSYCGWGDRTNTGPTVAGTLLLRIIPAEPSPCLPYQRSPCPPTAQALARPPLLRQRPLARPPAPPIRPGTAAAVLAETLPPLSR